MKKKQLAILLLSIFTLVACSSKDDANEKGDSGKQEENKTEETSGSVAVDKGLLNVEVTIPASFLEGEDIDVVVAEAKEDGIKEVTKNDDGSVTYKMTKAKHKEMMQEMKTNVTEYVDELVNNEDFASIMDIKHNKDFSKFTLEVDKEAFENSFDGFAAMGLGMTGMLYQLFNGVDSEKLNVTIDTVDHSSGEVFGTVSYPEAFEDME
ncbi:hypothetical protein QT711_17875 [Sporosarcina saromensis]|uniref:Antigen I/II N-terminal domain-containing protein n=1 Tax=Sporosarcina saromensis TaxID=359365 RepID=A0ABU4GDF4_9BACL|nr:hypothetical protein [Sporosarcina saromensis]MDW0115033.1 hypothetical protein [Sporosarcina saromensis]